MAALELVIGLGANLGDPESAFREAIEGMRPWLTIRAVSGLYQTRAIGPEQPDFLNAAVSGTSLLGPRDVLDRILQLEQVAGRVRRERWGPRCLDLDLLWLHDRIVDEPQLTVPHPRLVRRAFALLPLLDVVPEARDPHTGRSYRERLPEVADQRVEKRASSWL